MINASNHWSIIRAAHEKLLPEGHAANQTVDPDGLDAYDYETAIDQTTYEITGARFPELAMLEAYAAQGYLDNDSIWDEILQALARAIEAHAQEAYEEDLEEGDGWEE